MTRIVMRGRLNTAVIEFEEAVYNLGWFNRMDNSYSQDEDLDDEHTAKLIKRKNEAYEHLVMLIHEATE